jgi:hypothetical protein
MEWLGRVYGIMVTGFVKPDAIVLCVVVITAAAGFRRRSKTTHAEVE